MLSTTVARTRDTIPPILDLLDELDRQRHQSTRNLRSNERRSYRRAIIILPLNTPNAPLRVTARDISNKGCC